MRPDSHDFCRQFYSVTDIPVTYISCTDGSVFTCPKQYQELNLFSHKTADWFHPHKNPDYYIAQCFCYFGIVREELTNDFFIIGPVFSTPVNGQMIHGFMREFSISAPYHGLASSLLSTLPCVSFNRMLNVLSFIHLCLNGQTLNLAEHFEITEKSVQKKVLKKYSQNLYTAKEEQIFHNSFQFEKQWLRYVESGDTAKLKELLSDVSNIPRQGIVADNALRQIKNIFVVTAALLTRAAISGGLDSEQAYYLSDNYIQEMEKLTLVDDIHALSYTMLLDFTERVAGCKIPVGMSREVFLCIQYISQHTNESIRVDDVARFIHMSRSTITRKFKKELGFDISSFIKRCKLEEAKSLLIYTDKTLSEISSYLCFSSQSHFQNAFKSKYGMTPLQYRSKAAK